MQSILSQLTLQLLIYFQNDMHPLRSVLRFDMEDSVYKMIKNLDHSQSGSNVEYGRYCEQNVQKVFKNPDHCQSGSHPRCVIRDNWGEGALHWGKTTINAFNVSH